MRNLNVGKWQLLRSKIVGIIIILGLILTTLVTSVPNIEAQRDRDRDRDDRPRYEHQDRDYAIVFKKNKKSEIRQLKAKKN